MRDHRAALLGTLAVCAAALGLGAGAAASGAVPTIAGPPAGEHPPAESVVFLERVLGQIVRNQYSRAWLTLNPTQQQVIPQQAYVRCELLTPIAGRLDWIRATRVVGREIVVPGSTGETVLAQAVTFRLRLSQGSPRSAVVFTHTAHAVASGDRWTWILPARRFALHRSGACPGGAS